MEDDLKNLCFEMRQDIQYLKKTGMFIKKTLVRYMYCSCIPHRKTITVMDEPLYTLKVLYQPPIPTLTLHSKLR